MSTRAVIELTRSLATQMEIDPDLASSICEQESSYQCSRVRYEENWAWFVTPEKFASKLGITVSTERVLQKFSWGPMQVMGAVSRELGYLGHLTELIIPQNGILYGLKKLKQLLKKYPEMSDAIASYNAGSPRRLSNGLYSNQEYVDSVRKRLMMLKLIK